MSLCKLLAFVEFEDKNYLLSHSDIPKKLELLFPTKEEDKNVTPTNLNEFINLYNRNAMGVVDEFKKFHSEGWENDLDKYKENYCKSALLTHVNLMVYFTASNITEKINGKIYSADTLPIVYVNKNRKTLFNPEGKSGVVELTEKDSKKTSFYYDMRNGNTRIDYHIWGHIPQGPFPSLERTLDEKGDVGTIFINCDISKSEGDPTTSPEIAYAIFQVQENERKIMGAIKLPKKIVFSPKGCIRRLL